MSNKIAKLLIEFIEYILYIVKQKQCLPLFATCRFNL
jgi:hypothetical protein